jgi:hypothetical protein
MVLFSSLYFLFFAGSGDIATQLDVLNELNNHLIEIVQDDVRQVNVITIVNDMKVTVEKQATDYDVIKLEFLKINADYSADKKQYVALNEKIDMFWRVTMQKQVNLRFEMKKQLTREEWKKLYKELD